MEQSSELKCKSGHINTIYPPSSPSALSLPFFEMVTFYATRLALNS
jgi:hypothetical protein